MGTARTEISAADAVKFFKGAGIAVQEARPTKTKGDDGKTRDGYAVKDADLRESHVTGAADYGDRVVITTIDGKRHEAAKRPGADKQ